MIRRRDFIALIGGAGAVWPVGAWAQQGDRVWRIGVMISGAERDPEMQARVAVFRQALEQLGWYEGRNIRIDNRYAAGRPDLYAPLAKELVALRPDVMLAYATPIAAA